MIMKTFLFTFLLLGLSSQTKAQFSGIMESVYDDLIVARDNGTQNPGIPELVKLKYQIQLPPNFTDTLYQYDWAQLRSFHFEDAPDDVIYTWKFANFEVNRFAPKTNVQYFELNKNRDAVTFAFHREGRTCNHRVIKVGPYHYIASEEDGKTSYARIVRYQNGILISDVSAYGTFNSFENTNRIFRRVWKAIPKLN